MTKYDKYLYIEDIWIYICIIFLFIFFYYICIIKKYKMKEYKKYLYLWPPRPENKIKPESIIKFDNNTFISQCKFNGSNCTIYLNGTDYSIGNRHKGTIGNFKLKPVEVNRLYDGSKGYRVVVGEYMNKSKKDENGKTWNDKFVIFDILVNDGQHLIGSTYEQRLELLQEIYNTKPYNNYVDQITDNIFLIKSFTGDFTKLYHDVVKVDMLEGLVLKLKKGKLSDGNAKSNSNWMIKCRKPTLNYEF